MRRDRSLRSFKSYADRVVVGDPFGRFTCVVGPNGCGKSVVGEAIAFALGGNARMMRARNLGALVTNLGGGGSGGGSDGCSGGSNSNDGGASGKVAAGVPMQPAGRLLVRRRVTRAGRSDLAIQRIPAPTSSSGGSRDGSAEAPSVGEAAGGGSGGGGGSRASAGQWQAVTPASLHDLLAPFGIQTEAVDRFVVTQHRQAVSVQDPAQLARFLELLIGTAGFEEQLEALGKEVATQAAAYDQAEEGIAELELRRQQLAPEVAKWRRYREQSARHRRRKVQVLGQQAGLLARQLAAMEGKASELEASVAQQSSEQAAAKAAADDLLQRKAAAAKALRQAEKGQTKLAKAAAAAQLQAAKLRQAQQAQQTQQGAGTAVNAALMEVCNLAGTLVVSDRSTAQAVVSHFERHRVGIVTCKILSELQAAAGGSGTSGMAAGAAAAAAEAGGLQTLAAYVEARSDVEGAGALVQHLLHNWWLAPSRQAAMAAVQQDRQGGGARAGGGRQRRNIVTPQGDVFKANGEIVGARPPPAALRPYLLSNAFAAAGQASAAAAPALTAAEKKQLEQQAAALREQAQQLQAAAQQAAQQAEQAAGDVQQMREEQAVAATKLAAAERQLKQLQSGAAKQKRARQAQRAQQLQQALTAGREQAVDGEAAAAAAGTEAARAEEAVEAAQAAYESNLARSKGGSELLAAQRQLESLRAAAARTQEQVAAATAGLAAATRQQQQLAAAERAAQQAAADAERLRGEVEAAEAAAVTQQEEAASLAAAGEQQRKEGSRVEKEWRAAIGRHEGATKQHQQQQRRGRRRTGAAGGGGAAGERQAEWGEHQVEAAVEELAREEASLQALRASIDEAALAEDAATAARLEAEGRLLDGLAESLQALESRQAGLQTERFQRFHAALTAVNTKLTGVYTEDRLAAFTDGVTFHVRPDRQQWRPFQALSGGQQALATLALCFALQAAFPSPFYFFDEIDASLDTVNAGRVAEYIAAQRASGAQYIVVSHKPQVYEQAGCLVGVYSRYGASHAVTLHLPSGGGDG
ncbi:nuclear condensin complex subunit isoform A [Chlorella sorokiniana]|uniref:Nuclear condensin complex subunit isoform A n=1 Tax=Chlorella sorokiniana TaxID=3076 RepID=A0A2P6TKV2_CHLSO|nr:nuclear condensin complex subunit isoform A [Chlorella sorokiniana]|eukprot:PRW44928.1 nuclear condensin complex subunit isoform A [Chlorella sorokiniana]